MRRIVLASFMALGAACQSAPTPTTIVVGRVWTGDETRPWLEAVAVQGDTIVALGDSATILRLAGQSTEVLRGAFVVPGFQDDHTHFF